MLESDAAVENVFRPFHVRMRDGTEVEGFLKARNGHSVMPPLAAGLSDQQIAGIAAFLRGL